jgi:hypothetical protein
VSDRIDDFFGDLRDYPGKRKPVLRDQPKKAPYGGPKEIGAWDESPRLYNVKGVQTEFFTIRHVALALNRAPRTIRYWERQKVIPPATFRSTAPRKSKLKEAGDRLWTRPQVEAMVQAAKEEGVLAGKPPTRAFTLKVVRAFLALQEHSSNQ